MGKIQKFAARAKIAKIKRVGLALGGGSARGWAHLGVIQALNEAHIPIHCIAGTSIGALVGAFYASGSLDELEKLAKTAQWHTFLKHLDVALPRQGLIEGKKIRIFLEKNLKIKTIEKLPIPFCAIAADLVTGEEIRFSKGPLAEAVRASISIPGIFNPVRSGGRWLVDGGLVNPMPVSVVRKMNPDIVIGVDLNHDFAQNKTSVDPAIYDVIGWSVNIMQEQITLKNLLTDKPDILIRPKLGTTRAFDFHLAKPMIEEGYRQTKKIIPKLRKLIK